MCRFALLLALTAELCIGLASSQNRLTRFCAVTNAALDSAVTTCSDSATFAPGASCVLGIQFAPTTSGASVAGSVVLSDNTPDSSQTIHLSGPATPSSQAIASLTLTPSPGTTGVYGTAFSVAASIAQASGQPYATGNLSYSIPHKQAPHLLFTNSAGDDGNCLAAKPT